MITAGARPLRGDEMLRHLLLSAGIALFAASAEESAPASSDVAAAKGRAEAAATTLQRTLLAELEAAIAAGGPANAVEVCRDVAQRHSKELSESEGLVIRRTALRTRNPVNAPDAFEREFLESAEAGIRSGKQPTTKIEVVGTGGRGRELRMLRPLVFPGGICSQCHGTADEISPEVRAILAERYPDDRATGFRPGDLRGALSVRVPLAAEATP